MTKQERQDIVTVSKIFGDNGIIVHAADHVDIADTLQHMTEKIENVFVQKLIQHMFPLLVENAQGFERPGLHVVS